MRNPKIIGDSEAARLPAMFITPETVPLYSPQTSMGTAQAGPTTNSKKNNDPVKQRIAVQAWRVVAAGTKQTAEASMAGAATMRRANLRLPVFLYTVSVKAPPKRSPPMPAKRGREANMPAAFSERWRYSIR